MGPTEAVARFAVESDPLRMAPEVTAPARRAILDTLGVALAGTREPVSEAVAANVVKHGGRPA